MALGEYLKQARIKLGFSLREAEEKSGVSNAYISLIESGKRTDPHPNILKSLARAYGLDIKEVMDRAGYLDLEISENNEQNLIEQDYQKAISDPEFHFGRRSATKVDFETKKLIAKMYRELEKRREGEN